MSLTPEAKAQRVYAASVATVVTDLISILATLAPDTVAVYRDATAARLYTADDPTDRDMQTIRLDIYDAALNR